MEEICGKEKEILGQTAKIKKNINLLRCAQITPKLNYRLWLFTREGDESPRDSQVKCSPSPSFLPVGEKIPW
jgi:hypothetical protein